MRSRFLNMRLFLGIIALADSIKNNGALTSLNISNNNIGQVEWEDSVDSNHPAEFYNRLEDQWYVQLPRGAKVGQAPGVVALAGAISTNGALASLNLADNWLQAEGAKHVAEAIKVNVSALRFD